MSAQAAFCCGRCATFHSRYTWRLVMLRSLVMRSALIATVIAVPAAYAGHEDFHASFSGFKEVGALNSETGAIFSPGKGRLRLRLDRTNHMITFNLTYSGLSSPVTRPTFILERCTLRAGYWCSSARIFPLRQRERSRVPRTAALSLEQSQRQT